MSTATITAMALKRQKAIELFDTQPDLSTREIARQVGMAESTLRKIKADHEASKLQLQTLPLTEIRTDGGTQIRVSLNEGRIADYAEAYEAGQTLPPPVVFYDGLHYWLADGFQRREALIRIKQRDVACEVRTGSQRDALVYSLGANATHGLPRTNADKRNAVEIALSDPEWCSLSNAVIAEMVRVSPPLVAEVRESLSTQNILGGTARIDRNGREIDTKNLGRKPKRGGKKDEDEDGDEGREPGSDDDLGEPETHTEPGDPAPTAEQSFLDSIPLRASLHDRCRSILDRDALKYHRAIEWLERGRGLGLTSSRTGETQGAWEYQAGRFLRIPGPHAWLKCAAEGCEGGLTAAGQPCASCFGRGYKLP